MGHKRCGGRSAWPLAAGLLLATAGTAHAQLNTPLTSTAHIVEWDLTLLPDDLDANAAAVTVDTRGEDHNQLWFVTRKGFGVDDNVSGQRIYRFSPPASLLKADAAWTSWDLRLDVNAGGILRVRPSHDRRFVYVRSNSFIQRIDTQSCQAGTTGPACGRVVWSFPADPTTLPPDNINGIPFVSDIAADDMNRVFTTGSQNPAVFPQGYVQMLDPARPLAPDPDHGGVPTLFVKRWVDDQGAGQCTASPIGSEFCNAGIDVHPSRQTLVYFVETGADGHGFIAELNIDARAVTSDAYGRPVSPIRRWSLATLSAATADNIFEPRMLKIDRSGKVWVNTGSGHIVSLDPSTNRMTKHRVPGIAPTADSAANDLWAVAPDDDVIGYTAANLNKVAMMFPKRAPVVVTPAKSALRVVDFPAQVDSDLAKRNSGTVPGEAKIAATRVTSNTDGLFIEGLVDSEVPANGAAASAPSLQPLGITPNRAKAEGSFFYTVGATADVNSPGSFSFAKRVAFIRLPLKDKAKFARDDDDADDGFDRTRDARWHNSEPNDSDADGVPDQYDTNATTDNMTIADPAVVPAGSSRDFSIPTTATTLAVIAAVAADVPTATIAVDVYNALGVLVSTSGPIVGTGITTMPAPGAGTYKVRVRNLGSAAVTATATMVVREPMIQQ
jgi:hypothetical protein